MPVVISQYQPEVAKVFKNKALAENALLIFASKVYKRVSHIWNNNYLYASYEESEALTIHNYCLDLTGSYQLKNLPGVIKTLELARVNGFEKLNPESNYKALKQVKNRTGLLGRWQVVSEQPLTIIDTGHNEDGVAEVIDNINRQTYKQLHIVLGMVNDKDINAVLKLFPSNAKYYFTKASIPRALNQNELKQKANVVGLHGKAYATVKDAWQQAKKVAEVNDLIFIGGSTFIVADALQISN